MKKLSIISIILGLVALGFGLYCQLETIPAMKSLDRLSNKMNVDDPQYKATRILAIEKSDQKITYGSIALLAGGIGLLGGVFAGFKKHKLGFLAALISLPGLILGLLQATHMFS